MGQCADKHQNMLESSWVGALVRCSGKCSGMNTAETVELFKTELLKATPGDQEDFSVKYIYIYLICLFVYLFMYLLIDLIIYSGFRAPLSLKVLVL